LQAPHARGAARALMTPKANGYSCIAETAEGRGDLFYDSYPLKTR
jgi:hypothetical protein